MHFTELSFLEKNVRMHFWKSTNFLLLPPKMELCHVMEEGKKWQPRGKGVHEKDAKHHRQFKQEYRY